jgi:signal transduction histidine kinase
MIKNRLYLRISGILVAVLLVVGVAYFMITSYAAEKYFQETTQRLNAHVAEQMLVEVVPFIDGKVNEAAVGQIMHSMMAVNPGIEVYLLSPEGEILSFVVLQKKVKLTQVNMAPVLEFIEKNGEDYILGDDPRNPGREVVFSATGVEVDGELMGYVYMVLASEQYENVVAMLRNSFILKTGSQLFVLSLVFAIALGLLAFWFITSNLRKIIQTVRKFEEGDLSVRIPVTQSDDLAGLSHTFNHMADTLVRNIDQLKEVDHLRKELIANISHDLRTPLSVIHGYVETLSIKSGQISQEDQEKYLGIIMKSTERLKNLVSDLFELSQLEARQVKPNMERFAIAELISDLTMKYELLAKEKNITLNANVQNKNLMVEADLALIERALNNLLDNAIKHTPESGVVDLNIESDASNVKVSISNTGEGIAEEDIEHIFDRYFTKSETGKEGTGLGLAIVKNILEIHNSIIQVQSKIKERTTFFFQLPIAIS